MNKVYHKDIWICPICECEYKTEEAAIECHNTHYNFKDLEVIKVEYGQAAIWNRGL